MLGAREWMQMADMDGDSQNHLAPVLMSNYETHRC